MAMMSGWLERGSKVMVMKNQKSSGGALRLMVAFKRRLN
jgi:hypothetical protein